MFGETPVFELLYMMHRCHNNNTANDIMPNSPGAELTGNRSAYLKTDKGLGKFPLAYFIILALIGEKFLTLLLESIIIVGHNTQDLNCKEGFRSHQGISKS